MNLQNCIKIPVNDFDIDMFKCLIGVIESAFPNYKLSYKEPFDFWEHVPNPDYKSEQCPPDEEEITIHREAQCGLKLELKNAKHSNWNIKCFLYNDSIYIYQGVYHYGHYNAANLAELINFAEGNVTIYYGKSYAQWVKEHPDQKIANHNYKIDKEDLEKIGIIV